MTRNMTIPHGEAKFAASTPAVSVIIVNWNAGDLLRQAVASVVDSARQTSLRLEIVIVDNGSSDDSLVGVGDSAELVILRNEGNHGFGAACNQAATFARGAYLLFLNPDCRVAPGNIDACIDVLETDQTVGAVGVALTADDGSVWRSCHRFPTFWNFFVRLSGLASLFSGLDDGSMREWAHDQDRRVDHVIGAFYVVRAVEFRALGGFDERFFVYLEDLDLSKRYSEQGLSCYFLAAQRAYHKGGGLSEKAKAARLFYATRSRILYAFKHFGPLYAWTHLCLAVALDPITRLIGSLMAGRAARGPETVRAYSMLFRDLPAVIRQARMR